MPEAGSGERGPRGLGTRGLRRGRSILAELWVREVGGGPDELPGVGGPEKAAHKGQTVGRKREMVAESRVS